MSSWQCLAIWAQRVTDVGIVVVEILEAKGRGDVHELRQHG